MIEYLFIINVIAFISMKIDKKRAIRHQYRISERTLIILALLGGSIGIYTGMYVFCHKTQKIKFYLGIPCIFVIECLLYAMFLLK